MTDQKITLAGNLSAIHAPSAGDRLLVLAHGAGAGHDHAHMNGIAGALSRRGIGTLRFNFPFIEQGRRRVDTLPVCLDTLSAALDRARELAPEASLFLGGHSFGGRMTSHFAASRTTTIQGLVFFSFPLHVAGKPDIKRAAHLPDVNCPMLFLSGTRDALAEQALLEQVTTPLPLAEVHWLDTADHSFKILKRTRQSTEDVYDEAARVAHDWMEAL